MGERLTRKQLAARFGCSRQRIDELIGEGRLKEERATCDSDEADALWRSMNPDYVARRQAAKAENAYADTFFKARTKREVHKAHEAELDLKTKMGRLKDVQLVTQQAYTAGKQFHTRMSQLPRKLAPMLALESDPAEIERMLSEEINIALSEIRNDLAELGTAPAA